MLVQILCNLVRIVLFLTKSVARQVSSSGNEIIIIANTQMQHLQTELQKLKAFMKDV